MLHLPCFAPLLTSSTNQRTVLAARGIAGAAPHTVTCCTTVQSARSVLFASPVWPERSSSAAGVRTADLIAAFQQWGYSVAYLRCRPRRMRTHPLQPAVPCADAHARGMPCSPSKENEHTRLLERQGCRALRCPQNREAELTAIMRQVRPAICVFDR